MASDKGLDSLKVWGKSMDFAKRIHTDVLPILPKEETWALANQLRRSSQSIPANIAEGYGRYYFQETVRFCYIARGSLEETNSHLVFAKEVGYLPLEKYNELLEMIRDIHRMLNGYIAFLNRVNAARMNPVITIQ